MEHKIRDGRTVFLSRESINPILPTPLKCHFYRFTPPPLILALEESLRLNLVISIYPSRIPKENTFFIWSLFMKERKLSLTPCSENGWHTILSQQLTAARLAQLEEHQSAELEVMSSNPGQTIN